MAGEVVNYAFDEVSVLYANNFITGFFEGDDVITVDRRVDTIALVMGVGGDGIFNRSSDKSGLITLKLIPGSQSDEFLSVIFQAQEHGPLIFYPFALKNTNEGIDYGAADRAVIVKPPTKTYGGAGTVREWMLLAPELHMNG